MTDNIIEIQQVSKSFACHEVLKAINLSVKQGEFLTLLGPSGCGKTTLLRLISGFEEVTSGTILLNGQNVANMPPQARHVNTVFQSYALFPHITVFDNVTFGLQCHGVAKSDIEEQVLDALKMVKLEQFQQRKPRQLSGGQQQRVAIARAIVNKPHVLLLDEPLSSLDYRLRKNMQVELKRMQRQLGIAFIFVTHDQEEALSMSDRVVVLSEGHIEQIGTPRDVYETPKNLTVARFIGEVNIFDTQVKAIENDYLVVDIEESEHRYKNDGNFQVGQKIHVVLRPEDLRVWDEKEALEHDKSKMFPGVVEEAIYKGSTVDLIVRMHSGRTLSATEFFDEDDEDLIYRRGEKVWVHWLAGWEVILPYEI